MAIFKMSENEGFICFAHVVILHIYEIIKSWFIKQKKYLEHLRRLSAFQKVLCSSFFSRLVCLCQEICSRMGPLRALIFSRDWISLASSNTSGSRIPLTGFIRYFRNNELTTLLIREGWAVILAAGCSPPFLGWYTSKNFWTSKIFWRGRVISSA